MNRFTFHLRSACVPLMIILSLSSAYTRICVLYNILFCYSIVYFYIKQYLTHRHTLTNILKVIGLLFLILFGVVLINNDALLIISLYLMCDRYMTSLIKQYVASNQTTSHTYIDKELRTVKTILFRISLYSCLEIMMALYLYFAHTYPVRGISFFSSLTLFAVNTYHVLFFLVHIYSSGGTLSELPKPETHFVRFFLAVICTFCITEMSDKSRQQHEEEIISPDMFLYFDFKGHLNLALDELLFCINDLIKYYSEIFMQFYRGFKFLLYFIVVFISAVVFVWLFVYVGTLISEHFDPKGYIAFIDNYSNRSIFTRDSNGYTYERHINEDVRFYCRNHVRAGYLTRKIWFHNESLLNLSRTERIQVNDDKSELTIFLIDRMDYGLYKCVTQFYFITYRLQFIRGEYRLIEDEHVVGTAVTSHRLIEAANIPLMKSHHVDKGRLMFMRTCVYLSLADEHDLSFEYTVNGLDVHETCTYDIISCDWLSYLYKKEDSSFFNETLTVTGISTGEYSTFAIDLKTCICPSMYGLHKITIYRDFFNTTIQRSTVIEINHPLEYYFFPGSHDSLINEELYKSNTSLDTIRSFLNTKDEIHISLGSWFPERKLNVSFMINVFIFSIFGCLITLVVWVFSYLVYLYYCITIAPFRNLILFGSLTVPRLPSLTNKPFACIEGSIEIQYDVYVSSCEDDREASMLIVRFLEEVCSQKVCFSLRDLEHEAGVSHFKLFARATEQSKKFVVVLSKNYIEDELCHNVQLTTCIIPMVQSERRQGHDLVLLKLDRDIQIPVQVSFDPDVTTISYTKDDNLTEANRKLRRTLLVDE